MRRYTLAVSAIATLVLGIGLACGGGNSDTRDDSGVPAATSVSSGGDAGAVRPDKILKVAMANIAFSPKELNLEPGKIVEFQVTNSDGVPHTFTIPDWDVDLELAPGEIRSVQTRVPENYASTGWKCRIHGSMKGTISLPGGESPATSGEDTKESPIGGYSY